MLQQQIVTPCKHPQCVICPGKNNVRQFEHYYMRDATNRFRSSVTGREFQVVGRDFNCDTVGIVYLATCANCGLQYIGGTTTTLKIRIAKT